jgi:hypothetical protein
MSFDLSEMSVEELEDLNRAGLIRRHAIPEYEVWQGMKQRCSNPNNPDYNDWGGLGIAIHEPWQRDFWAWFHYMGRCPDGFVNDRINNDGSYVPGNVRWADRQVSNNNKRKDKYTKLTMEDVEEIRSARGGPFSQAMLGEIYGINQSTVAAIQTGRSRNPDGSFVFGHPPKIVGSVGERNGRATITEAEASLVKGLLLKGHRRVCVAERLRVTLDVIRHIKSGDTWCDVSPDLDAKLPPLPGPSITRRFG